MANPITRAAFAAALCSVAAFAGVAPAASAKPATLPAPQLNVYLFVLDGLDRDAVIEGEAPFLSSLMAGEDGARGTFFPNSRSVMIAETNPNHTSMITGAFPRKHGVTGNEYAVYGPTPDEDSCSAGPIDSASPPVATSGENRFCPRVDNLFAAVERQPRADQVTTALIMGKPKLARLFSTQRVTPGDYDADYIWAPCDNAEDYCEDVPTNPITGYALDDEVVMDQVIETTQAGVGPDGTRPDFTFVNLPQIDSAGHAFGRSGAAYSLAISMADEQIARFVANQKEIGIWERTVMLVVSDHGLTDTPQLAKISLADILSSAGVPDDAYTIVGNGTAAHIYLNDRTAPDRFELLTKMRTALAMSPGILDAVYRQTNPADGDTAHLIPRGWGLGGNRSGDIVITTGPGVGVIETSEANTFPFNPVPGNHGSTTSRENFWLIAGGSPLINQGTSERPVTNANAAPTVTHLLNRKRPDGAQANWVRQAFSDQLVRGAPKH